MTKYKSADNLEMREDDNIENESLIASELIIMRIPSNVILEGNMLKLSAKDALEIIANLAVQVALSD